MAEQRNPDYEETNFPTNGVWCPVDYHDMFSRWNTSQGVKLTDSRGLLGFCLQHVLIIARAAETIFNASIKYPPGYIIPYVSFFVGSFIHSREIPNSVT